MSIYNPDDGSFIRYPSPVQLQEFSNWETHPDDWNPPPPLPSPDWSGFRLSAMGDYEAILMAVQAVSPVKAILLTTALVELPGSASVTVPEWNEAIALIDPAPLSANFANINAIATTYHCPVSIDTSTGILSITP